MKLYALSLLALVGCTDWGVRPVGNVYEDSYVPEAANPVQTDRTVQVTQPKVDVLFVVDNSCSMDAEQNALADNFPSFMTFFEGSGLDYHIGVVSTDMAAADHSGKLRQVAGLSYIDDETPNPAQIFQQMAVMGTSGDAEEMGRAAAYTALELRRDGARNQGFMREDASLHLVFISDEDDQSTANPVTRNEFIAWMDELKWSPDMVSAHAIIWRPGTSCLDAYEPGATYRNYVNATGGILFDICSDDWGPFLEELGLQSSGLRRQFYLSKLPVLDPWSLEVSVVVPGEGDAPDVTLSFETWMAGSDCDVEYNAGLNSISFTEFVPPPLSSVLATYNIREHFEAVTDDDLN